MKLLDRYVYIETRLPWPVSDRDTVLRAFVTQNPETYVIDVRMTSEPDRTPRRKGYIRMPHMEGHFVFTPKGKNQLEATYQVILDPGGHVPVFMANIVMKDTPYFTLKRLRRMLLLEQYQNKYFDYIRWPSGRFSKAPLHTNDKEFVIKSVSKNVMSL